MKRNMSILGLVLLVLLAFPLSACEDGSMQDSARHNTPLTAETASMPTSEAAATTDSPATESVPRAGQTTVYLGGPTGDDRNSGYREDAAVGSLSRAYQQLPDEGGEIVLCGDVRIKSSDGSSTPFGQKQARIRGKNGTEILHVDGAKGSATLVLLSPTELSDFTLNWRTADAIGLYIFSGPSLTVGDGMTFTRNGSLIRDLDNGSSKDHISVRVGAYADRTCREASYVQKSGALSSVYGGNNKVCPENSRLEITGSAELLVRLQSGATSGNVEQVDITIDGDSYIETLILGGHGDNFSLDHCTIHMTGGEVKSIIGARTEGFKLGDVKLTVGGTTRLGTIAWTMGIKTGTSYTLTFDDSIEDELVPAAFGDFWTKIYRGDQVVRSHILKSVAPVCDAYTGNAVCYLCTDCGTAFADPDGKTVADSAAYRQATAHTFIYVPTSPPTCTEDGVRYAHYRCTACRKAYRDEGAAALFSFSVLEPKLGHDLRPTAGNIHTCARCGKRYRMGAVPIELAG